MPAPTERADGQRQSAPFPFPLKFMKQHRFVPLMLADGRISVLMSDPADVDTLDSKPQTDGVQRIDPADVDTLDSIRLRLGGDVQVQRASDAEILAMLEQQGGPASSMQWILGDLEHGGAAREDSEDDATHLQDLATEAPVIRLVNLLMAKAVERRASDIHVEPFEARLRVRYRIDGVLVDVEAPPKRLQAAIVSRIKLMARMNIAERRLPQDGRIRVELEGRDLDLRVSTIPTVHGESLVMRLLDRASVRLGLDELGFPAEAQQRFESLIAQPHGIILVTGPTGSGKTTTLYAALRALNSSEKKIITIEDPVEYQLEGVNQIHVKPKIGLTFATGLRHIVRQDPDVILVGEIRDRETADIAIHAALTGHLVLSTLHTNDAAGAITRLLDMGLEDYLVSSTLLAVLAQRLVRSICRECAPAPPAPAEPRRGPREGEACPACGGSGYFGRTGIFELLVMDEAMQRLILGKADANAIRAAAVAHGMETLWENGRRKMLAGLTTLEEIARVTREG
jgi:general secretion pathway protein E